MPASRKQKTKHIAKNIDGVTHIVPKKSGRVALPSFSFFRAGVVLILLFLVTTGIFVASRSNSRPDLDSAKGIKEVLSKHILVPNEQPVIATVTDKTALKTPFLQESENGDKIVIYEKAKKVVIYRPSIDRVVNIGPVELNNIPKVN